MVPENAKPGDTVIECPHGGYVWPYSGSLKLATCPSCGSKCKVSENQQGIVLSCEEEAVVKVDRYGPLVRKALSRGLKRGNRNYRMAIGQAFPTEESTIGF